MDAALGRTNLLTVKEIDKHFVRDSKDSGASVSLEFNIARCDNKTKLESDCASEAESVEYLTSNNFYMMTLQNFIEYEEVDPGVGPVVRIPRSVELKQFNLKQKRVNYYSFVEH